MKNMNASWWRYIEMLWASMMGFKKRINSKANYVNCPNIKHHISLFEDT